MPSVSVSVIDEFLHPPIGVLGLEPIPGFFSGQGELTRGTDPFGLPTVDAFGIAFSVVAQAPGLGYLLGYSTRFELRACQIVVVHRLLDGTFVNTQVVDSKLDSDLVMFDRALPAKIGYHVTPGFLVSFDWLLIK